MGRTYVRKTTRQSRNPQSMSEAIKAVKSGETGTLKAAKLFAVPRTTMQRLAKRVDNTQVRHPRLDLRQPVFTPDMEAGMVLHIKDMDRRLFGFTTCELRKVAYQYA